VSVLPEAVRRRRLMRSIRSKHLSGQPYHFRESLGLLTASRGWSSTLSSSSGSLDPSADPKQSHTVVVHHCRSGNGSCVVSLAS
jgi:hypothetical protein